MHDYYRYVHPNKRSGMQGNRSRGGYMSNTRPPNQIPPRWQNQHHHHHQHNFHQNPPAPPHHHPPHHQTSTEEPRLNGSAGKFTQISIFFLLSLISITIFVTLDLFIYSVFKICMIALLCKTRHNCQVLK